LRKDVNPMTKRHDFQNESLRLWYQPAGCVALMLLTTFLSSGKRVILVLLYLAFSIIVARAQAIYTPYTFSTLAGAASIGSADGTNGVARFYGPTKLVMDNSGNLYVSDTKNFTIRKIAPVGTNWVVTTIAGLVGTSGQTDGTGSTARFFAPYGMALDDAGNLFVADYKTLREMTLSGGEWTVNTIGNGFLYPYGVALDAGGNIYIADSWNQVITQFAPAGSGWNARIIAGSLGSVGSMDGTNGTARFNYPQGLAVDSATNIYVADTWNDTIRKITLIGTNWVVTTLAGKTGTGSDAVFKYPQDVAVDRADNIYVADGSLVFKITPDDVVTTLAGTATDSVDSVDGTNSDARFGFLTGITVDSATNIFVADNGKNNVRKVTPDGTNWVVTTIAGLVPGDLTNGVGSTARFYDPAGVTVDSSGNVYVADTGYGTIRKITPDGAVTTIAGLHLFLFKTDGINSQARFSEPWGIATDNSGSLYVADDDTLRKITPDGTNWVVTTIASGLGSAEGLAIDSASNVYVADWTGSTIRKVAPDGTKSIIAGLANSTGSVDGTNGSARFNGPEGIAVDGAGNLYVADTYNYTIRKISPLGTNWVVTTIAGLAGHSGDTDGINTAARFFEPAGIAVDTNGNLFIAEVAGRIRKMTPDGPNWAVTTLGGALKSGSVDGSGSVARFNIPNGIAVGEDGTVYVADTGNGTIRKGVASSQSFPIVLFTASPINGTAPLTVQFNSTNVDFTGDTIVDWSWDFGDGSTGTQQNPSHTYMTNGTFNPTLTATNNNGVTLLGIGPSIVVSPGGIGFDDLSNSITGWVSIPDGYGGLTWINLFVVNGVGYPNGGGFGAGVVSASNVVYNGYEYYNGYEDVASVTAGSPFNLISAYLTAAWYDNLQCEALGYAGSTLTYSNIYTLSATNPTLINFNYFGVNAVYFIIFGGTPHPGYIDYGEYFVMDNMIVSTNPGSTIDFPPQSLSVSNGLFQFLLTGPENATVILERSTTLTNWTAIATNTLPLGGWPLSLPTGTNARQFYRARLGP
jgi:PKD repeat protein